jgi:hypothetical protein
MSESRLNPSQVKLSLRLLATSVIAVLPGCSSASSPLSGAIPADSENPRKSSDSPTISGPEIEQLLRANLEAVPGSGTDPSQIRCPVTREYRDGDVARCSVPVGNGGVEVLLVTLFKEGDGWRFTIDIQ